MFIFGTVKELETKKRNIKWGTEAKVEANISGEVTASLSANYGQEIEQEQVQTVWKRTLYFKDTMVVDVSDCNFVTVIMMVPTDQGNKAIPLFENLPIKNHPHGYIWYLY